MKNTICNFSLGSLIVLCFNSCATYQIPVESLKLQFEGIDSSKLIQVVSLNHRRDEYSFLINPIKILKCLDNDNNPMIIRTNPKLIMIVTDKNKNKTEFSFDRVFVSKSFLYGKSVFINEILIAIPLKDITRVDIRDDRRKFEYGNVDILRNH